MTSQVLERTNTDAAIEAMWAAEMSTASIADAIGWTEAQVVDRMHRLREVKKVQASGGTRPPRTPRRQRADVSSDGRWATPREKWRAQMIARGMAFLAARLAGIQSASAVVVETRPFVSRYRPVTERTLLFARRFPATHWTTEEVAALFNVHPAALAEALGAEALGSGAVQ